MNHRLNALHLLAVSTALVLAAMPVHAQSALTSYKDLLTSSPPQPVVQQNIDQLVTQLIGASLPQIGGPTQTAVPTPTPVNLQADPSAIRVAPSQWNAYAMIIYIRQIIADAVAIQRGEINVAGVTANEQLVVQIRPVARTMDLFDQAAEQSGDKSSSHATTAALVQDPVNQNAATLQAWMENFAAGAPAYGSGIRPVWADVLPSAPSAYYTGSAVAVMPNGASSTGDLTLDVDFTTRDVWGAMTFYSADPDLAGDIEFAGKAQIGGSDHTLEGDILYSGAFGGVIEDGDWSGAFYGPLADLVAGDWQATVDGGPNAGTVHGKFGGRQ